MNEQPDELLCFCNRVSRVQVKEAIAAGASTLATVYERSGAGTGPCGGSCRSQILCLLGEAPTEELEACTLPNQFVEAVSLFNRRYFWECHEVLEHLWLEEHGERRLFYQGIIQAAAALYHVLNANPKGVIRLAEEARKKLTVYLPKYQGVSIQRVFDELGKYIEESKQILGRAGPGFDYDHLPMILIGATMSEMKTGVR